ncbi:MAG: dihydrofolate reductase [Pseudomonadota bacterium]
MVAAMARNRVIGRNNQLPWRLPADLRHFKQLTLGKPIVMGRRTWESLPGLLPDRAHIVITRNPDYRAQGATLATSLEEAIEAAGPVSEIMVVGGADIYRQALEMADRVYLTIIEEDFLGDARFPPLDGTTWKSTASELHAADDKNPWPYRFVIYERGPSETL